MILSRRVELGGIQLDGIDSSIVIRGVDPGVPHENISAANLMGGAGQRITSQHWETLDCAVSYAIDKPKTDLAGRRAVFDAVNTWALSKGWLKTNEMPGKRMRVDKVILPGGGDMREWTKEYQIIFRAYSVPFWQDEEAEEETETLAANTDAFIGINVGGNTQTVLDIEFTNTSGGTVSTFRVSANGRTISLSDFSLANGKKLILTHGTDGLLQITADGTSIYNKQAEGADDLYAVPGYNTVSVRAGGAGSVTVSAFGRYL